MIQILRHMTWRCPTVRSNRPEPAPVILRANTEALKALQLTRSLQLAQRNRLPAVASHPCFGDLLISLGSQRPRLRAGHKGQQGEQQGDQHISFCDVS